MLARRLTPFPDLFELERDLMGPFSRSLRRAITEAVSFLTNTEVYYLRMGIW